MHGPNDFDVTTSRLQDKRYFQGIYCMYYDTTNCVKTIVCGVAINYLEITLILQPAGSDVKIGLDRAHMGIG